MIQDVSPAASDVGLGHDASERLKEVEVNDRELGLNTDVEAAIAVQERRRGAVAHQILPMNDEHGHARPVLALEEHLLGHVVFRVEPFHVRLPEHLPSPTNTTNQQIVIKRFETLKK